MVLSDNLVLEFAKLTNDTKHNVSTNSTMYGTVVEANNSKWVKIDGSEQMTPISTTTTVSAGDRVTVSIQNHKATINGNLTAPSASTVDVHNSGATATNFISFDSDNGVLIGNKLSGKWSGSRAQITSNGFNILDSSGSQLATFGSNRIELGKNDKNAVISLCNDTGSIGLYKGTLDSYEHLGLNSNRVVLNGKNSAGLITNYDITSSYHISSRVQTLHGVTDVGYFVESSLLSTNPTYNKFAYVGAWGYSDEDPHVTLNAVDNSYIGSVRVEPRMVTIDAATIALNGNVTISGVPISNTRSACSARGSASSLSLSAGTITPITLDTWVSRNDSAFYFSGGGIACPRSGNVMISGNIYFSATAADNFKGVYLTKNGSEVLSSYIKQNNGYFAMTSGVAIIPVSAGDIIGLRARCSAANTVIPSNASTMLNVVYV